jgi:hypothetical protein
MIRFIFEHGDAIRFIIAFAVCLFAVVLLGGVARRSNRNNDQGRF